MRFLKPNVMVLVIKNVLLKLINNLIFLEFRYPVPPCQFPGSEIYTSLMAFLHLDATYEEFVRDERCLKIKSVLYIFACLEVYSFCILQSSQMLSLL